MTISSQHVHVPCIHCIRTECMYTDWCLYCHVCNAGAPGRTVLRTDWVLLGKYDIINK